MIGLSLERALSDRWPVLSGPLSQLSDTTRLVDAQAGVAEVAALVVNLPVRLADADDAGVVRQPTTPIPSVLVRSRPRPILVLKDS